MTAAVIILAVACVALFGCCAYAGVQIERLRHTLVYQSQMTSIESHQEFINDMWNKVCAENLLDAADAWDTVEEQGKRKQLSWTKPPSEAATIPALWLRDRAEKMRTGELND